MSKNISNKVKEVIKTQVLKFQKGDEGRTKKKNLKGKQTEEKRKQGEMDRQELFQKQVKLEQIDWYKHSRSREWRKRELENNTGLVKKTE